MSTGSPEREAAPVARGAAPAGSSGGYRPKSRRAQAVAGVCIAAGGVFVAWLAARQAGREGSFLLLGGFAGPAFAVIGLGLAAFGGYREERLRRGERLDGLAGMALLTTRWRIVLAVALAAGAAWTAALRYGWVGR
jgi:hypothetical protein